MEDWITNMGEPRRFTSRDEITEQDISPERESTLREIFKHTEFGEHITNTVAATFNINGDLTDNTAVLSSRLHHDQLFDQVASYMGNESDDRKASATVIDKQTLEQIRADVINDQILISPRSEDLSFQTFRDYILYLESKFDITLSPAETVTK